MKQEPHFRTEAELCSVFTGFVKTLQGWVAYAETAGWDILLAHADGTQIGIQAKLKLNLRVLEQTIEESRGRGATGPDFRAVLVPGTEGSSVLIDALGINLIKSRRRYDGRFEFEPGLLPNCYGDWQEWHYANPEKRHELPEFVPDVAAGVPGPSQLTKWKIAALRIVAVLEVRGYVTRADFRRYGVNHCRWVPSGWLKLDELGRYTKGPNLNFAEKHPVMYPQILAEIAKDLPVVDGAELRLSA